MAGLIVHVISIAFLYALVPEIVSFNMKLTHWARVYYGSV
jgi:hypothetical protein